jgi:hypothetical protein
LSDFTLRPNAENPWFWNLPIPHERAGWEDRERVCVVELEEVVSPQ